MSYTLLGQNVALAREPQNIGGVTYVPLRDVITAMGGTLDWDAQNRVIACRLEQWRATTQDGSTEADVSGTPVSFSAPVRIIDDVAWVPLDFFQSAFGLLASATGSDVFIANPNA